MIVPVRIQKDSVLGKIFQGRYSFQVKPLISRLFQSVQWYGAPAGSHASKLDKYPQSFTPLTEADSPFTVPSPVISGYFAYFSTEISL